MIDSPAGMPWFWPAFLTIGTLSFGWHAFVAWRALGAEKWPRVTGNVLGARTQDGMAGDGERWADVTYRYEVAGKEYRGSRVRFRGLDRGEAMPRWTVEDYRPGRVVQVAYNPRSPDDAVLEPGVGGTLWMSLAGSLVLALVGLYHVVRVASA